MPKREPPQDLDKYRPDEATAEAVMNGPTEFKSKADPKLIARLKELNRLSSNPEILPAAPPSVATYVPPMDVPGASGDETTLPRGEPKVELALPPSRSESPTQPSLRRLEGEPELPGVVKRPARARPPHARPRPISLRGAVFAVLAVLAPVLVVIFVMGRAMRNPRPDGAASALATSSPSAQTSALPAATVSAAPTVVNSAAPAPSVNPSAKTSATTSAAVPGPTGAAPKPRPHVAPDDPYDAAPPATSAPSATPKAVMSAVPTALPSETRPPVPPPPPSSSAPTPWFTP